MSNDNYDLTMDVMLKVQEAIDERCESLCKLSLSLGHAENYMNCILDHCNPRLKTLDKILKKLGYSKFRVKCSTVGVLECDELSTLLLDLLEMLMQKDSNSTYMFCKLNEIDPRVMRQMYAHCNPNLNYLNSFFEYKGWKYELEFE